VLVQVLKNGLESDLSPGPGLESHNSAGDSLILIRYRNILTHLLTFLLSIMQC